jgi:hypothetical protein
MNRDKLKATQRIELYTAESFIEKYNSICQSDFRIVEVAGHGESPDIMAKDSQGTRLNIEVTMTEDRHGNITAALGRSEHKLSDAVHAHLEAVDDGREKLVINCLQGNVLQMIMHCIEKKLLKRYGTNVALVVRDTSPHWDWDLVLPELRHYLSNKDVPFDKGIWIVSRARDRIIQIW